AWANAKSLVAAEIAVASSATKYRREIGISFTPSMTFHLNDSGWHSASRSRWHDQFFPGLPVEIFSITSLTVKLAALARGGNSLKLSMYFATKAWAGTSRNDRCACQSA